MKKIFTFLASILISLTAAQATIWTINSSGFTFSPNLITITLGDTVVFNLVSNHDAMEVSQATWNSNGSTSNGGFTVPFGGGTFIPTQAKTYYYICENHISMGMKGQIIVNPSTGISQANGTDKILRIQPNPASSKTYINTGIADGPANNLIVYDLTGRTVVSVSNIRNNYPLDLSGLKQGIYFVEFRSEGYRRTGKMIVSRE